MSQLDDLVERVRVDADALYSFVLSRRGDLVTKGGLREIPEPARKTLADAAEVVAGSDRVLIVKLGHAELVPGKDASVLDVHVGVAAGRAVLCLVGRSGVKPTRVANALRVGLRAIEPMLSRAKARAAGEEPTPSKRSRRDRDTGPSIAVEPARKVGSSTLRAIEKEIQTGGSSHVPAPHIPRDVLRTTLPWRETPATPSPAPPPKPRRKAGADTNPKIEKKR